MATLSIFQLFNLFFLNKVPISYRNSMILSDPRKIIALVLRMNVLIFLSCIFPESNFIPPFLFLQLFSPMKIVKSSS